MATMPQGKPVLSKHSNYIVPFVTLTGSIKMVMEGGYLNNDTDLKLLAERKATPVSQGIVCALPS